MNIVVQTYDGRVQCRPDTSWEREDRDLFAPDFISVGRLTHSAVAADFSMTLQQG